MEGIELLILFGVALLFAPWIFVIVLFVKQRRLQRELQERFAATDTRLGSLEDSVRSIRNRLNDWQAAARPASQETPVAPPVTAAPPSIPTTPVPAAASATHGAVAPPPMRVAPAVPVQPAAAAPPRPPVTAAPPSVSARPVFSASVPEPSVPFSERIKDALDMEERLGANWLNKIGIVVLVFGIAFFLAYQLKELGPAGKVLVGYIVSFAILGGGVWLERKDNYRVFARAGIGGGWALTFFTTYAMYHVAAAKVLDSQAVDLFLMLLVGAGMVMHSLRYRSQVVTGLAFMLAYSTITISNVTVYSFFAGAVLTLGLVVIVVALSWFELEVFGILAAFGNHYLWQRSIIEPMGLHKHAFPQFFASAALLIFYWLVFRASYVQRTVQNEDQEKISTVAALLNSFCLLALLKYQSVHPEWAFYALLVLGAVELLFAYYPKVRLRRTAFAILATLGSVLLIAALPFKFSGANVEVLWLALAEALVFAGIFANEVVFRRTGVVGLLTAFGHLVGVSAARVYGIRMDDAIVRGHYGLAGVFALATIVFYLTAYWIPSHWPELFRAEVDRRAPKYLSYCGAILAVAGIWIAAPAAQTIIGWSLLGVAFIYVAERTNTDDLFLQGSAVFVLAILRAIGINFETTAHWGPVTQRGVSVGLLIAGLYVASRWARLPKMWEGRVRESYRWAGSLLGGLLLWYELRPVNVAVGWAMFGLVLLEFGLSRRSLQLRLQAYLALIAAFTRLFFVNMNAAGAPGVISPRVYTTIPVIFAFFYGYWRVGESDEEVETEKRWRIPEWLVYFGTISAAGLIRFEMNPDLVAPEWGLLVLLLFAIAWNTGRKVFLHQALLMAFATTFRSSFHNLYDRNNASGSLLHGRIGTVVLTALMLFAGLVPAFRMRKVGESTEGHWFKRFFAGMGRRPEQVLFFLPLLLVAFLLYIELPKGLLTLSWGVLGVVVFLFALWVKERSFRLAGLGLLLLCVGKIVFVDVWGLEARDRYLTFIVLGASLLLVSFLYSRFREAIRQYL